MSDGEFSIFTVLVICAGVGLVIGACLVGSSLIKEEAEEGPVLTAVGAEAQLAECQRLSEAGEMSLIACTIKQNNRK